MTLADAKPLACPSSDEVAALCARLLAGCNGHPSALVPWPHALLHEAVDALELLDHASRAAAPEAAEAVVALAQMVETVQCRQANAIERRMVAERLLELAAKYAPLVKGVPT